MKIGIIGCGNMGSALIQGMLGKKFAAKRDILASDRDRKRLNLARLKFGISLAGLNSGVFKQCDVVILAVKPQDIKAAVKDAPLPLRGKLVVSICAGITTKRLEKLLAKAAVVRVMPNMPAQIGQGISAISVGRYAKAGHKRLAKSIFSCVGEVVEIKESLMDAVTAISGSGPAYLFYLVEKLIDTAKELGIPHNIAQRLAIKTASGSTLLMNQSKAGPEVLRKQVTSKGGTTEAAFKVLKKRALGGIVRSAPFAAAKRSRQLRAKE